MKTWISFAQLLMAFLFTACSDPACFDLVYNPTTNTCDCPEGTTPNYMLDRCEGEDGLVIPWSEVEPMYAPRARRDDGGTSDGAVSDAILTDAGIVDSGAMADAGSDAGSRDVGPDMPRPDAGPPPPATQARFPWNGLTTGSVHVPTDTPLPAQSLRPKLIWERVSGADHYQVQMTRECTTAEFRGCAFDDAELDEITNETTFRPAADLPVQFTRPVGDRYYWRVRACTESNVCSTWTTARYLDVGRLQNDYNGDGYPDLLVGARFQDNPEMDEGTAYVYLGGAGGLPSTPSATLDNPADDEDGRFGYVVASAGDVNADGYADAIIGAVFQDAPELHEGNAFLYLGGPTGLAATPSVTLDNPTDQPEGLFGCTVAGVGDINGDGFADVAVGARWQSAPENREGNVFVFYGSSIGINATPDAILDNPADQAEAGFGAMVTGTGDVDGDGYPDVAVGALWQDSAEVDVGAVYVYHGGPRRIEVPQITLDSPSGASSLFGAALSNAADINGDGYADLSVGSASTTEEEQHEGAAFVFYGGPAGLPPSPSVALENPEHQEYGYFGGALNAGDVNGDGYDDLIIGALGQNAAGEIFVYLGTATGIASSPDIQRVSPTEQNAAWFGEALSAINDFDGDGFGDIGVAAPAENAPEVDEGNVFVYFGEVDGMPEAPRLVLDNPRDQIGGRFGSELR